MSAQILPFPAPSARGRGAVVTTHPFGGCPRCSSTDGWHADRWDADGYPNDERDYWFFCDRHKTRWRVDTNLFSGGRDENHEVWLRNRFKLARYMWVVEPVMPLRQG